MKVYVLIDYVEQEEYTEPKYWSSAAPYTEILGIYASKKDADKERRKMEKAMKQAEDDEDEDEVEYHQYFVHEWEVQ